MSRLKKRPRVELHDDRKNKQPLLDDEQSSLALSNLRQCSICNRRFTENRLDEHQRACQSSSHASDRHHYNSQLHRWKGLNYGINARHHQLQSPKTFWREKHQQLQAAIPGQNPSAEDSIQASDDRPYQCSRCHRKFATDNARTKHQKGCSSKRSFTVKTRNFQNKKSNTF